MSKKNNLIQIQIANDNSYSAVNTPVLAYGSPYTLDQLGHIKERLEQDRTLWNILPETLNTVRKLRIQKRKKRGQRGGVEVHQVILASKRSLNINDIIQFKAKVMINYDKELWKNLRLTVINIWSIKNKDINLLDHLVENKTDICIVTETWLNEDDKIRLECCGLSKNGFQIQSVNRKNRKGGGLAIISTINIKIKLLEYAEKSSFKYAVWKVSTNNS